MHTSSSPDSMPTHATNKLYIHIYIYVCVCVCVYITNDRYGLCSSVVYTVILHSSEYSMTSSFNSGAFYPIQYQHPSPRVHSATQRHQSPERSILSQFSGFMQLQIQEREITLDDLQPGSKWPPRWRSSALRRMLKNDLTGICILIHSRKMSKENIVIQILCLMVG